MRGENEGKEKNVKEKAGEIKKRHGSGRERKRIGSELLIVIF